MVEKGDLFGDGVNVAARLEGLAEKGGICISGSTFDQVKNKLSIAFDDIGAQRVKNIPEPVPAFRLVPGKVAVESERTSAPPSGLSGRMLAGAGAAVALVLLGGAYFAGLLPFASGAKHPFDGHWKVTVDSLTGCLNNNRRSFPVMITQGRIEIKGLRFPKTGSVSPDGTFTITSTDQSGNQVNTQTGKITGNRGTGRFIGRKPKCRGTLTLVRVD
jgi:hypothetical protein